VVWTGSTNLTFNGLNRNNNNAILLNSEKLSVEFTAEFEQMYGNEDYGAVKEDANSSNEVSFNDGVLEFYFAPQHEPVEVMEDLIDEADHSALFMVFSFTHPNLSDALIHAKERGVDVAGILDES
jgi:phosphatidylserine/phosphatidylglycerophosphate/cardiolipin synthase-like enzyme